LVRFLRGQLVDGEQRGDVVEADADGRIRRLIGDAGRAVPLAAAGNPFGVAGLLEAGGGRAFDLDATELAVLAGRHSGEDLHVRTLQALLRRVGIPAAALACGSQGMPLDRLTAARLTRDGDRPGPLRHACSGEHVTILLLAKLGGWTTADYWRDDHPALRRYWAVVGQALGIDLDERPTVLDRCGLPTPVVTLAEVARAFAFLAEPRRLPADDPRASLAAAVAQVRDAMVSHPELVSGSRDRVEAALMKAAPGRIVAIGGLDPLHAAALLPLPAGGDDGAGSGLAIRLEAPGGEQALAAAAVEAVRQLGVLDDRALRLLGRYHRPAVRDPHGRAVAELVPAFDLAPVGELL
jgi:L-asparaginase II